MKRLIYLATVFLLILTSCVKEPNVDMGITPIVDVDLSFVLSNYLGEMSSVQTKTTTSALKTYEESGVNSLWILQFRKVGSSSYSLGRMDYVATGITEISSTEFRFATTILATLPDERQPTKIYIIANVPDKFYDDFEANMNGSLTVGDKQVDCPGVNKVTNKEATTEADFFRKLIPYSSTTEMPWYGKLEGTIEGVKNGAISFFENSAGDGKVHLKRFLSKITFAYSVDKNFREKVGEPSVMVKNTKNWIKVTGVNIKDAPNQISANINEKGSANTDYHLLTTGSSHVSIVNRGERFDQYKHADTATFVFYMPERMGGVPKGMTYQNRNTKVFEKLGDVGVESPILSYINLEGEYHITEPNGMVTVADVVFPIYLGNVSWDGDVDSVNGYNVVAGTEYRVNLLNINDYIATDPRVTLTLKTLTTP